jgi:hypothetical protein
MVRLFGPEQRADGAAKVCNGKAWHNLEIPPNQIWIAGVLTRFQPASHRKKKGEALSSVPEAW